MSSRLKSKFIIIINTTTGRVMKIKFLCMDLPDQICNRLDQLTIEKINKCFQIITDEENIFNRSI